ncbi:hypothetical protein A3765_13175 [Oleiphilus sp. HI0130]|nr:hypothetical protein A3765_13175 [Oleiphilus sp. HI0130]
MQLDQKLTFLFLAITACSFIVFPKQIANVMQAIYSQKSAPRNLFVQAIGVIMLLIVLSIYIEFVGVAA